MLCTYNVCTYVYVQTLHRCTEYKTMLHVSVYLTQTWSSLYITQLRGGGLGVKISMKQYQATMNSKQANTKCDSNMYN